MASPEELDPVLADLGDRIRRALAAADLPVVDPAFERPKDPSHGDWASTMALRLAKPAKQAPRAIAEAVVEHLELPDAVSEVSIAGPGFLNFRFGGSYWAGVVRRIVDQGESYGRRSRPPEERQRVNGEFVSANPTGPLHVGAGRWVATGDAIAALLEADGHEVTREYYLNDAGEQVKTFGDTVLTVSRGEPRQEHHYQGDYVEDIVAELRADLPHLFDGAALPDATDLRGPERSADGPHDGTTPVLDDDEAALVERLGRASVGRMVRRIRSQLAKMGVEFDVWFSEAELHRSGALADVVSLLTEKGLTFEQDGAVFLRTTDFGDDKDRVLIRANGVPTYFAADCAYMQNKVSRGFDRLIYLLGADHHGYVGRLKAVGQALGLPEDMLEIRIGQLVNVLRDGEPVKMSKRAGTFVTLDEVVDEVGADVARYHFLRVGLDVTQDFDLGKVTTQSAENPVYYVQYAHARIATLLRKADEAGFDHGDVGDVALELLTDPAEAELLRRLSALPEVISSAAEARATQRLAHYIEDTASAFHKFYNDCPILKDDVDPALAQARWWLAAATKQVVGNALAILRVSAPDAM